METKRCYFTHTLSGYIDVPKVFTTDNINDTIQKSIKTIGIRVNKSETWCHKIHLPKRKVSI